MSRASVSKSRLSMPVRIVFAAAAIAAAGGMVYQLADFQPEAIEERSFDSELWKNSSNNSDVHSTVRSSMARDLLSNYDFSGWSKEEIVDLLGEHESNQLEGHDISYIIGRDSGYGIDFEWLVFDLDEDGTVIECKVLVQ